MDNLQNLLVVRDGPVARVTINRPKVLNALNAETLDELRRTVLALKHDADVGAVIVTGAGDRAFVAGADINELAAADAGGRTGARAPRPARVRPDREHGEARDRGDQRVRARRRLRAGDGLHAAVHAPTPRRSVSRRSTSASFPATAARSGWRGWWARAARWSCCCWANQSARRKRIGSASSTASCRRPICPPRACAGGRPRDEGACRDAVHHRGRQQGTADAARGRPGPRGRRSSDSWRAPTTCAKARGRFSRSASPCSRGRRACAPDLRGAAAHWRSRLSLRDRLLALQRTHHGAPVRRRAGRVEGGGGAAGGRRDGERPWRVRAAAGRARHRGDRAVRRGDLPGMRHSRRHRRTSSTSPRRSRTGSRTRRREPACRWRSAS